MSTDLTRIRLCNTIGHHLRIVTPTGHLRGPNRHSAEMPDRRTYYAATTAQRADPCRSGACANHRLLAATVSDSRHR